MLWYEMVLMLVLVLMIRVPELWVDSCGNVFKGMGSAHSGKPSFMNTVFYNNLNNV